MRRFPRNDPSKQVGADFGFVAIAPVGDRAVGLTKDGKVYLRFPDHTWVGPFEREGMEEADKVLREAGK